MDAKKIRDMLNARAEDVCHFLLPSGKLVSGQWSVGDAKGAEGDSLKVFTAGPRAGFWHDFATPVGQRSGGDLFHLWMEARNCNFVEALRQAKNFLGIRDDGDGWKRAGLPQKKAPATGMKHLELHEVKEGSAVWTWLTEARKITPKAIRAYRLGEARIQKGERDCVVFPSFDAEGNLVRLKYRDIHDKTYMFIAPKKDAAANYEHGAPMVLFGLQAVGPEYGMIAITEGELDALSMFDAGCPAVSLPIGAQVVVTPGGKVAVKESAHDAWLESCHDWLERFCSILIATDMDVPGRAAIQVLVPRLGRERCLILDFPFGTKDANDCAQAGIDIMPAIERARECDPEELKRPSDFAREIWEEFYPSGDRPGGDPAPWVMPFRFRDGEVTIWQGFSGSGKSVCLGFTMLYLAAKYGRKSCIASLEMPAKKTFKNIMRQGIGQAKPANEDEFRTALSWMDQFFFVYDRVGEANSDGVIEIFTYAAKKYGVRHFILDSLMKLSDVGYDDYNSQRKLINALGVFADEYNAHVHLVCHSRKPDQRHPENKCYPDKHSVSGHGDITNGVDNVVCVWRNRDKEENIRIAELKEKIDPSSAQQIFADWKDREDSLFIVQKQRETGAEPIKRLFFDAGDEGSWQYWEEQRSRPVKMIGGDKEDPDRIRVRGVEKQEIMFEGGEDE